MSGTDRAYECIVFGATGYTGKYTAEHIATHLPTDFKWAVAGRSENKLRQLVDEIRPLNPDRIQPDIEVAQLEKHDLVRLAQKTRVLITTVGPYHRYGTAVFEACAETGTHYLDVTGEYPWVYDMVQRYHATAQRTGAIMIPQNGLESAPADLLCWSLVSHIRHTLGTGTAELIQSTHEMSAAPSGGTLATVLSIFGEYSLSQFARASRRWALCPVAPPPHTFPKPLLERLTGVRTVRDLGTLTDSLQGPADIPIVHRTWGLYDAGKFYGPNFRLSPYTRTRNALQGFGVHLAMVFGMLALVLPPVRWLLKYFVYQPGQGVEKEEAKREYVEWRAIAHADDAGSEDPKRAFGRMRWEGSMYHLTGVCLAEAALTIARSDTLAHRLGGGVVTPATLGVDYLTRLRQAGLKLEIRTMP